jgi:hypothetical protein
MPHLEEKGGAFLGTVQRLLASAHKCGCSATCWLPYTNLELSRSLTHVFGNVCTVLCSEPEQHHICETIKQANFTPLTLDPTTTAYIQQIIGGLLDQLRDYLLF